MAIVVIAAVMSIDPGFGANAADERRSVLLAESSTDLLRVGAPSLRDSLQAARDPVVGVDAGDEEEEEPGIADNSFLIEEAFNQERGVVQHIFNWVRSWDWGDGRSRDLEFLFTQEWPIGSKTHQFSYAIPAMHLFEKSDGEPAVEAEGIGDVMLNYRLQVWDGEGDLPAFAPRFSVILPTGDEDEGLGSGEVGYQINLPFSKELDRAAFHFNAGITVIPDVAVQNHAGIPVGCRTFDGFNLGGSAIWFARPTFHLMFETVALWSESATEGGGEDHELEVFVSPGLRWAPYTAGDTQIVVGIGVPIGVSTDAPDVSVFFYLSLEHRFSE